ncbi:MAG: helix-turn-helix domain-containing protein [Acidobacteria bacterium]|nr:MAG: helix-turn-helix domain-containing protein [Acidobacteriota bacterium]
MEQAKPVEAPERPAETTADAESFGTWLRRQREGRQIALREIADQSKISLRYLQALEADRFDVLPAPVFAKGFLRQYARYVGLDPEEVVNFYLSARSAQEGEEEDEPPEPVRPAGSATTGRAILWAAVALAAVLALILYLANRRSPAADEPDAAMMPPPPPAAVAPPEAAPPEIAPPPPPAGAQAPLVVVLDFSGECWVQARVDGSSTISRTYVEGESVQLDAQRSVELTLGDGSAVRIEVNGRPFALEGGSGQVVRGLVIDLDAARRLAEDQG